MLSQAGVGLLEVVLQGGNVSPSKMSQALFCRQGDCGLPQQKIFYLVMTHLPVMARPMAGGRIDPVTICNEIKQLGSGQRQ